MVYVTLSIFRLISSSILRIKRLIIETLLGIDIVEFYRGVLMISSCVIGCSLLQFAFSPKEK